MELTFSWTHFPLFPVSDSNFTPWGQQCIISLAMRAKIIIKLTSCYYSWYFIMVNKHILILATTRTMTKCEGMLNICCCWALAAMTALMASLNILYDSISGGRCRDSKQVEANMQTSSPSNSTVIFLPRLETADVPVINLISCWSSKRNDKHFGI